MNAVKYDLPNEEYHNKDVYPHISSSDIKEIEKTSLLHWAIKSELPRKKPTPAMVMGSAIHAMISEPEKELFVRGLPDRRKRSEWAKLEEAAEKKGQTVLTESEYDEAKRISDKAVETCPVLKNALSLDDLLVEASIFTKCPHSDMLLKIRPDMMSMNLRTMWDIKTTTDVTPDGFAREMRRWGYPTQAAFYLHAAAAAGIDIDHFIFLAVDKETGICVAYELSELYLKYAEKSMFRVLDQLTDAEATGQFDTGWDSINTLHLPAFLEDQMGDYDNTPF